MRGRRHYAVAARRPDGAITVLSERLRSRVYTGRPWSLPFLRGAASLWEMLALGMRALQWSANVQLGEDVELSPGAMRVTIGVSLVFGLGLFIGLPLATSSLLGHGAPQSVGAVLIEGACPRRHPARIPLPDRADEERPARLRVPRRRAQGHQLPRVRRPGRGRQRAPGEPSPPALRHRVPGRGGAGERDRLHPAGLAVLAGPGRLPDRPHPGGRRGGLRGDPGPGAHPSHPLRPDCAGPGARPPSGSPPGSPTTPRSRWRSLPWPPRAPARAPVSGRSWPRSPEGGAPALAALRGRVGHNPLSHG